MVKLMNLELKRNNINTYIYACIAILIFLTAFIFFIANVAHIENDVEFQNYKNIYVFVGIMSMIIFSILIAVMYTRFIISEYTGKRLALLFTYPISRKKIFLAKIFVVFLFNTVSMLLCNAISFIIFNISESISPIVNDTLTQDLLISAIISIVTMVTATNAIGLISMRIGFIKKSVPTTLVTSFILAGLVGNTAISAAGNIFLSIVIIVVSISAVVIIITELAQKINRMEVE